MSGCFGCSIFLRKLVDNDEDQDAEKSRHDRRDGVLDARVLRTRNEAADDIAGNVHPRHRALANAKPVDKAWSDCASSMLVITRTPTEDIVCSII